MSEIKVSKEDCLNISKALTQEWLETNGMGGYASSSILCCHTRRYHGFLVARLEEPPGKFVLFSKTDDTLFTEKEEFPLGVHQYADLIYPAGHRYMTRFEQGLVPRFTYSVGLMRLNREIALVQGEDTVLIRYATRTNRHNARLRIKPLFAFRDFHALTRENLFLQVRTFPFPGGFFFAPYPGMPLIYVQWSLPGSFYPSPMWYRNFFYFKEQRRGFDGYEDLFCPGVLELDLPKETGVFLSVALSEQEDDLDRKWSDELDRRRRYRRRLRGSHLMKTLGFAARHFLVSRPDGGGSVVAGYPWFQEWGRDAMISLPGLTWVDGGEHVYLEVLETFARHEKDGLIPNYLGSGVEQNAYNSADTSLWFSWAIQQYLSRTENYPEVQERLYPTLKRILKCYREGTVHGIRMLPSGLLQVGNPDEQITWMDARVNGIPVTPRNGCPVEINALWYNFLLFMAELARRFDDSDLVDLQDLAGRMSGEFMQRFWHEEEGRLYDVVFEDGVDDAMRPNQIFAVSLTHSPMSRPQARRLLEAVRRELLTPFGLRTLSTAHSAYQPRYEGGPEARDRAYHNGTVWPWLLGHYAQAWTNICNGEECLEELRGLLAPFSEHLGDICLGSISEVFDGTPPYYPHGCPSQAWSVSEILRIALLLQIRERSLARIPASMQNDSQLNGRDLLPDSSESRNNTQTTP